MNKVKSIFASKTIWVNGIVAILAFAAYVNPSLLTMLGIDATNQAKVLPALATITGILNVVLRTLNGAPISLTPTKDNAANAPVQ